LPILIAIIVFGLVVLVHEVGHFVAARRAGILVTEFAIGMGPKLFGFRRGETLYTIRVLPLGGFCLMYNDDVDPLDRGDSLADDALEDIDNSNIEDPFEDLMEDISDAHDVSFNSKTVSQRMSVMFAGSFMNFILAFILFSIVAWTSGFATTTLMHVSPQSPAEAAGLAAGDRITSLNGSRIFLWNDIEFAINTGYGRPIDVGFVRDGQHYSVNVTPTMVGERYMVGIRPEVRVGVFVQPPPGFYRAGIGESVVVGFMRIGFFIRATIVGLVQVITAQISADQMAGPLGIVNMIGGEYQAAVAIAEEAQLSTALMILTVVITMANFAALISANLGVLNLLPIPGLDGGRIIFLVLEAIRRKPLPPEREGMVHLAGFVLLLVLIVFLTYQDIMNLLF